MRELSRVEVDRVSGGSPHIFIGAAVGGVIGGFGYWGANPGGSGWGLAAAVGQGAVTGAFGGGAVFWGKVAARATFTTARNNIAARAGRFSLGAGATSFGGGMGAGFMGPGANGPRSQACTGKGGGSW